MSGQLVTLVVIGGLVFAGWCFLAGPCKGQVPEIDKIAQAAQDSFNELVSQGKNPNVFQGVLNSATNVFGNIADPKIPVTKFADLPTQVQDDQLHGRIIDKGGFAPAAGAIVASQTKGQASGAESCTFDGACKTNPVRVGTCIPCGTSKAKFTRANLGEISHIRMSIG